MNAQLQLLVDRSAIIDLVHRYATAVDERDLDAIAGCFTDDAVMAFDRGRHEVAGRASIRAMFAEVFEREGPTLATTHLMANIAVTVDGDDATSRVQCVSFASSEVRADVGVRGLSYDDEHVRTPDGWRIRRRTHAATWQGAMARGTIDVVSSDR